MRPYYPRASKILDSVRTNGSPVARSSGVRGRPSRNDSRRRPPSRFPFPSRPTTASKASNAPRSRVSANGRSIPVSSSWSRFSASFFRIETDTRIQPESRRFAYRLSFASYLIFSRRCQFDSQRFLSSRYSVALVRFPFLFPVRAQRRTHRIRLARVARVSSDQDARGRVADRRYFRDTIDIYIERYFYDCFCTSNHVPST